MPAPALKNAPPWEQIHLTGPYKNALGELVSFTENHEGIAHRVNMHDRLVAVLDEVMRHTREPCTRQGASIAERARAVLAEAKGEQ